MDRYDFIEMSVYGVHSIPRGRLIARKRLESIKKKGVGVYSGICFMGAESTVNESDYFGSSRNYGNAYLVPIMDTLVDAPTFSGDDGCKKRVGQVLCQLHLLDGRQEPSTPRYVAECQIERLAGMNLKIQSSHEIEFNVLKKDGTLWGHDTSCYNMKDVLEKEDILVELCDVLSASGVKVDTVHCEGSAGEYEVTLAIEEGIKTPDMTSRFKTTTGVFFKKKDMHATFMSQFSPESEGCGLHFNHSLWTRDGHNALWDLDQPDRLSKTGRHWLAGLIAHAPALTALCCPTVNCYRYVHHIWAPSKSNWGIQDRTACFRLVVESDDNIFLECRLASSAANSYLVLAGVVAAGIDGLKNELSLEEVNQETELPRDLETALEALERDTVLVEYLGKEFIECFLYVKRKYEIEPFKALGQCTVKKRFEAEKKLYF